MFELRWFCALGGENWWFLLGPLWWVSSSPSTSLRHNTLECLQGKCLQLGYPHSYAGICLHQSHTDLASLWLTTESFHLIAIYKYYLVDIIKINALNNRQRYLT